MRHHLLLLLLLLSVPIVASTWQSCQAGRNSVAVLSAEVTEVCVAFVEFGNENDQGEAKEEKLIQMENRLRMLSYNELVKLASHLLQEVCVGRAEISRSITTSSSKKQQQQRKGKKYEVGEYGKQERKIAIRPISSVIVPSAADSNAGDEHRRFLQKQQQRQLQQQQHLWRGHNDGGPFQNMVDEDVSEMEFQALLSIYSSACGPICRASPKCFPANLSRPVCANRNSSWEVSGIVICEEDNSAVTTLALPFCSLSGPIPEAITNLTALTILLFLIKLTYFIGLNFRKIWQLLIHNIQ
jgi:hypothetical protein